MEHKRRSTCGLIMFVAVSPTVKNDLTVGTHILVVGFLEKQGKHEQLGKRGMSPRDNSPDSKADCLISRTS